MTRAVPLRRQSTALLEQRLREQRRRKAEATTPGEKRAAARTVDRLLRELRRRQEARG